MANEKTAREELSELGTKKNIQQIGTNTASGAKAVGILQIKAVYCRPPPPLLLLPIPSESLVVVVIVIVVALLQQSQMHLMRSHCLNFT